MSSGATQRSFRSWFGPWQLLVFLGVLVVLMFPGVVFGTRSFFYRDFQSFGYPLAHYYHESFWRGEMPFWNPSNNCGLPFLAQWNALVFYPGSLIYLLFPLPWSLNAFCLLHLFLGAFGMHALAYRWTQNRFAASAAGLAYSWNGLTLHALMWPNNIAALGWMPLVVLATTLAVQRGKRTIALAGLTAAMQMLAGAAEIVLLTWIICGVFVLAESLRSGTGAVRSLARFVGVAGICASVSALQLLPFLDLLFHTRRNASFADATWSMPIWGVANFFVPLFGCTPSQIGVYSQDSQQWTSSYYLGIGVLVLAVLGARRGGRPAKILAGIAFVGVVFALGDPGYVYAGLRKIAPVFGFIRFPIKYVVLVVFTLPLLAAFGIEWWQRNREKVELGEARRTVIRVMGSVGLIAVLLIAAACCFRIERSSPVTTAESGVTRLIFLLLGIGALLEAGRQTSPVRRSLLLWAVLALMGIDIATHMPRENPSIPVSSYSVIDLPMHRIPKVGESRAMIHPRMQQTLQTAGTSDPVALFAGFRRAVFGNWNLVEHVPKVNGFFALYLREAEEVNSWIYSRPVTPEPLMDFLGVSQISDPETLFLWHARTNFMPLVTAGQRPVFVSSTQSLAAISSPAFDPRREVYLPSEAESLVAGVRNVDAKIISSHFEPERISAEVESPTKTMLVIAQTYYHRWKARVDGVPTPLLEANHAFQALVLPAGRHKVTIEYRDEPFWAGTWISGFALLGSLSWLLSGLKGNGGPARLAGKNLEEKVEAATPSEERS